MNMSHDWQAIKANNPIAEVVGKVVQLKKQGHEYKGLCPFHSEKSPSFHVIPDKGFYHCFGCGAHGDVVDFVSHTQGITQSDALSMLDGGNARLNPIERKEYDATMAERDAQQKAAKARASLAARTRWDKASTNTDGNAYLTKKGVIAHECKSEGENLLLPIYGPDGDLQSVQSIAPDSGKLFHTGAPTKDGRMMIGIHMGRTIICEGYATGASIHDAVPDQVCIAFSKGNMHVLARELAGQGVSIVLAADTNAADEMRILAKELDCPLAIPIEGSDFNDQATANGIDSVASTFAKALRDFAAAKQAVIDDANAEAQPVDLWAKYTPPVLPKGVLPDIVERFACIRADQMGIDPGGLAMSAITVAAAVIRDSIKIKVKRHENWTESARLWTMLIGDPSYKKSPIMRAAASKIKKLDGDLMRAGNKAMLDWQENGGNKGGGPMPAMPRLRVEDVTMEATQEVCRHSPDGILVLQDELSGWFGGIEKYSGGKGSAKDRSFWLTAFGGGEYAVNRVGRGSFLIDNLSVSILGGVQPDPIRRIVGDATDDGLIQRFLPIILQPAGIGRDEESTDISYEYDDVIERLHGLEAPDSILGKLPLQFDDGARAIREKLEAKHHKLVCSTEGFNKKLAAHIGKFDGIFPRLCIIFHCLEYVSQPDFDAANPLPITVTKETASRVETFLSGYIMKHSLAFYAGVIGLSDDHDDLMDVAGYILAKEKTKVTIRDIRMGIRSMRKIDRDAGVKLFQRLEALSWVDPVNMRADAPSWNVNPAVHELFAAKANQERERRAEMRSVISEMLGE